LLTLTVTAKLGEKTAYLVEIQQAGIFTVQGFTDEQLGHVLGAFCPNTLFPFAREVLASMVSKGGFPPLLLNPINFDALYLQRLQSRQAQQTEAKH
jgi:preprotein translocase subunit SecB